VPRHVSQIIIGSSCTLTSCYILYLQQSGTQKGAKFFFAFENTNESLKKKTKNKPTTQTLQPKSHS